MRFRQNDMVICLVTLLCGGCLESYPPPGGIKNVNYLVVDAVVDIKSAMVKVILSRTAILSTSEIPANEPGADVTLEDDQGSRSTLTENSPGVYAASGLMLSLQKKYRLNIKTSIENKSYQSDFIALHYTPPIDSITYVVNADDLTISVNTHDPTATSLNYRWKYIETWEYTAEYHSSSKFAGSVVVERTPEESLYTCWRTESSTNIFIASTKRLREDVVSHFPLISIRKGSRRLSVKYSILVQQQALSDDAYAYWQNLQRNTENLGGLFDPSPSELKGNMRCISVPDEPVIGFFSGGSLEQQRIFIAAKQLPDNFRVYPYVYCPIDTIPLGKIPTTPRSTLFIGPLYTPDGVIIAYTTSTAECIDCRVRDIGVLTRPDFWK
jgi:hypothetical protein